MRPNAPFLADDLADLDDRLLSRGRCLSMREVFAGDRAGDVIGIRHDCDWDLEAAVHLACWEEERGYRSTFYFLHTAPYWANTARLREAAIEIAGRGHEIGLHIDAIGEALVKRSDPISIFERALEQLRGFGVDVVSTVGHGNPVCYVSKFANDELFVECARPDYGAPDRLLHYGDDTLQLQPISMADYGLLYDPLRLGPRLMQSDSGGRWNFDYDQVIADFPGEHHLHFLWHPDWWGEAF